jgi:hypothetical protein
LARVGHRLRVCCAVRVDKEVAVGMGLLSYSLGFTGMRASCGTDVGAMHSTSRFPFM